MAKLIWLGEPDEQGEGPRKNTWNGYTFMRGEAVEIDDKHMIAKAKNNPFYSVDGKVYTPDGAEPKIAGPVVKDATEFSGMKVAELREIAAERGVDVEGMNKAEIVDALLNEPAITA